MRYLNQGPSSLEDGDARDQQEGGPMTIVVGKTTKYDGKRYGYHR